MKFKEQAAKYIEWIQSRRRSPVRSATVRIYQSYLDSHIIPRIGHVELHLMSNGIAKNFVAELNKLGLAPSTINQIFNVVKAVAASYIDQNGDELVPIKWNHDFIDLPIVNRQEVDAPIVTPEQINTSLVDAPKQVRSLLVLLAASGLRIGEALALQGHRTMTLGYTIPGLGQTPEKVHLKGCFGFSYWEPDQAIVYVKSTLVRGKIESQPKTEAGNREIDLHPDVNQYLIDAKLPETGFLFQNSLGSHVRIETAYDQLEDVGITEGFHAFRRFRATHLESRNIPRSLVRYWLGHSSNTDITDRYIKIGQDLATRKEYALKAGYGFSIPTK
jgi:integrase